MDENVSTKDIRRNCLECSDGPKSVLWCQCDGINSTACVFWPSRFGVRPATFRAKYGDRLLTPELMPSADVDPDLLPGSSFVEAATGAIDVPGYQQPAVELPKPPPKRQITPEQRRVLCERLARASKQRREAAQAAAERGWSLTEAK